MFSSCGNTQKEQKSIFETKPTTEQRVEELISTHIKNNIDDPVTYEVVEFGRLDSATRSYPLLRQIIELQDDLLYKSRGIGEQRKKDTKQYISELQAQIDSIDALPKEYIAYIMRHTYRVDTRDGKRLFKSVFAVSKDFKEIEELEKKVNKYAITR